MEVLLTDKGKAREEQALDKKKIKNLIFALAEFGVDTQVELLSRIGISV